MSRLKSLSQRSQLSISEASRLLGVSETTLRQWTDEGKIRAFITPGGHRRYSRVELQQFMGSQKRVHTVKDLVTELEHAAPLHREIAHTLFSSTSWYKELDIESQQHLAAAGRRLLNLVIKYITEPPKRDETVELVREVGCDFGETLAKLGLSLTDSIEAFINHRDPVVNAATHLMKGREALNERAIEAIPLVSHIMDEVLVSLITAYEKNPNTLRHSNNRGTDL
jgi:excisionase family DNA binding protein